MGINFTMVKKSKYPILPNVQAKEKLTVLNNRARENETAFLNLNEEDVRNETGLNVRSEMQIKYEEEKAFKEYLSDEEEIIIAAEEGLGPPTDEEIKAAENELDDIMSAVEDVYRAELLPSIKEDEKERKKTE